jgi:hypothetical protein
MKSILEMFKIESEIVVVADEIIMQHLVVSEILAVLGHSCVNHNEISAFNHYSSDSGAPLEALFSELAIWRSFN